MAKCTRKGGKDIAPSTTQDSSLVRNAVSAQQQVRLTEHVDHLSEEPQQEVTSSRKHPKAANIYHEDILSEITPHRREDAEETTTKHPLHTAAKKGTIHESKHPIKKPSLEALRQKDEHGWTALHVAIVHKQASAAKHLVTQGAPIEERDNKGRTPLLIAAQQNLPDIVALLVAKKRAQINANKKRWSSKRQVAARLRAYVDTADQRGWTALHHAAANGNEDMVKELIAAGAQVDSRNSAQRTPLHYAAAAGHSEIIRKLITQEIANIQAKRGLFSGFRKTKRRVKEGAQLAKYIGIQDEHGRTALHYAAAGCDTPTVEELAAAAGAQIDVRDQLGYTPLMQAIESGGNLTVKTLIENGADMYALCSGKPLLKLALNAGNVPVAELLVSRKVNLTMLDESDKHSLLRLAVSNNKVSMAKSLIGQLDDGSKNTQLFLAAANGCADIVDLLVSLGVDVNSRDGARNTALHLAAGAGSEKTVEVLVQQGAKLSANNNAGEKPHHLAKKAGHIAIKALLKKKLKQKSYRRRAKSREVNPPRRPSRPASPVG